MGRNIARWLTAGALGFAAAGAAFGALAGGTQAQQASQTRCEGSFGDVRVGGDLVVPRGAVCELDGTRVSGDVIVLPDAELVADGADIGGALDARGGALVDLFDATLDGDALLRESLGLFAFETDVGGGISSTGSEFVDLYDTTVVEDSRFRSTPDQARTEFVAELSRFDGELSAGGVGYFDVFASSVGGVFAVRDAQRGSFFCDNTAEANATFADNLETVRVGDDGKTSGLACDGSRFAGEVRIDDNRGETTVYGNRVGANLSCSGNQPPPEGGRNRVRGQSRGQCAGFLQPRGGAEQQTGLSDGEARERLEGSEAPERHAR